MLSSDTTITAASGSLACVCAFSPDSSLLATGATDGSTHIYNTSDWSLAQDISVTSSSGTFGLAWSPDGSYLMAAAHEDNLARIYDASDWSVAVELDDATAQVEGVAWSNQSGTDRIIVGAGDNSVFIYDVSDPNPSNWSQVPASPLSPGILGTRHTGARFAPDDSVAFVSPHDRAELYELDTSDWSVTTWSDPADNTWLVDVSDKWVATRTGDAPAYSVYNRLTQNRKTVKVPSATEVVGLRFIGDDWLLVGLDGSSYQAQVLNIEDDTEQVYDLGIGAASYFNNSPSVDYADGIHKVAFGSRGSDVVIMNFDPAGTSGAGGLTRVNAAGVIGESDKAEVKWSDFSPQSSTNMDTSDSETLTLSDGATSGSFMTEAKQQ